MLGYRARLIESADGRPDVYAYDFAIGRDVTSFWCYLLISGVERLGTSQGAGGLVPITAAVDKPTGSVVSPRDPVVTKCYMLHVTKLSVQLLIRRVSSQSPAT